MGPLASIGVHWRPLAFVQPGWMKRFTGCLSSDFPRSFPNYDILNPVSISIPSSSSSSSFSAHSTLHPETGKNISIDYRSYSKRVGNEPSQSAGKLGNYRFSSSWIEIVPPGLWTSVGDAGFPSGQQLQLPSVVHWSIRSEPGSTPAVIIGRFDNGDRRLFLSIISLARFKFLNNSIPFH